MDDYTLIIPTYQRPAMLRAALARLARDGHGLRALVLDSSTEPAAAANRNTVREHAWAAYRPFDPATKFAHKLLAGLRETKTPFTSLCADDDLIFPGALAECVAQMRRRPELAAAHGVYLNFIIEEAPPHAIRVEREYDSPSLDLPQPGARLVQLLGRYEALYYAVFRTPTLLALFDAQAKIESLHYQELFQAAATVLAGQVLRIPEIYCARRADPRGEVHRPKCEPVWWIMEEDYVEFFEHYLSYRALLLEWWRAHEPALDERLRRRLCDGAHWLYLRRALHPDFIHKFAREALGLDPAAFAGDPSGLLEGELKRLAELPPNPPIRKRTWPEKFLGRKPRAPAQLTPPVPANRLEVAGEDRPVQFGNSLPQASRHAGILAAAAVLRTQVGQEAAFEPPAQA